ADIPGLIEGAAEGAGLGVQFLKHLSRTSLLLHLVDVAPIDESDPVESFRVIEKELQAYSEALGERERWLVLNKVDLLAEDERKATCNTIIEQLNWQGKVFMISAAASIGTQDLSYQIMQYLDEQAMENEPNSHATYSP
ncbi:MAG: GTPase, partial [Leucothrix sp.]